jgi:flagellar protein FlbD
MIPVTRLDGQTMLLNNDLIESIEPTPDTLITMSNGEKLYVRETPDEIVELVVAFKQRVIAAAAPVPPVRERVGDEQWQ